MEELMQALEDATNVSWIMYDKDKKMWVIEYKNGLDQDLIPTEHLIDFLTNA